ncbi:HAD family hydrolase [Sulfurimonas sp. HSL-3221]|uniref:HAD family hydrolase n=1 Tax=Sulfurimonadaceae TaxID=2771471 RepID=UPI001E4E4CF8|nr:HAD family hydrolase [Sulfurimonas sp. HSL-3221]UFS62558.1 HAD family hydrolase [Sulfurimonas sp. HSL-3221]
MPNETVIDIPHYATLRLRHVVLDYNGTLALDGALTPEAAALLGALCARYDVHVITSDTFGTVAKALAAFDVTVKVLQSSDHTGEKAAYIWELGAPHCAAVGNGGNDAQMLKAAGLGIALVGDEGCATATLMASDIVCKQIGEALGLLLNEKRLIATLRR